MDFSAARLWSAVDDRTDGWGARAGLRRLKSLVSSPSKLHGLPITVKGGHLNGSRAQLDAAAIRRLAEYLLEQGGVTCLDVSCNMLSHAALPPLARAIASLLGIQTLRLRDCRLGDVGVALLGDELQTPTLERLEEAAADDAAAAGDAAAANGGATTVAASPIELPIIQLPIGRDPYESVSTLSLSSPAACTLRSLELSSNAIGGAGAKAFASALGSLPCNPPHPPHPPPHPPSNLF